MMDFLANLFGREVVYLLDHDGEVTKRWAKRTPFGMTCFRHWPMAGRCLLLPDGTVKGPIYVRNWLGGAP
jgi:hypothetical protein